MAVCSNACVALRETHSRTQVDEPLGGDGGVVSTHRLCKIISGPPLFFVDAYDLVFLWARKCTGNTEQKAFYPLLPNVFFPEHPKRLCWVLWAAEDCWLVHHLERQMAKTAELGAALVSRLLSWDKISASCAQLEYYGQHWKKEKHHLKHFNCHHMWSGYWMFWTENLTTQLKVNNTHFWY